MAKLDAKKCKVRCHQWTDKPTGRVLYEAYIYEDGHLDGCVKWLHALGETREGALKKLALLILDNLLFEEEQNAELRQGG